MCEGERERECEREQKFYPPKKTKIRDVKKRKNGAQTAKIKGERGETKKNKKLFFTNPLLNV